MKTVASLTFRSLVVPPIVLLWSCSGAPTEPESDPMVSGSSEASSPSRPGAMPQDPESAQQISEQRRQAVIEETLAKARKAQELKLWDDVRAAAADVLQLDPDNDEARGLLHAASTMLGDPTGQRLDFATRAQVAYQRDLFRAREQIRLGDALMEDGQYGDAVDRYERARLIMQFSVFAAPNAPVKQEIETKLQMAEQRRAQAMTDEQSARRAASQQALEDAERRARIARKERVERLLTQANMDFQRGRYRDAVTNLDQALAVDPSNVNALALRDLAGRARHETTIEVLRQRWKSEWSATFDDLRSGNVPQTDVIKIDPLKWAEIKDRQPISFTPPDELDSPEERAIRQKLTDTVLNHKFASATIQDWARYYQSVTDVLFFVHPEVADLEETTLTDFSLPSMSVEKALNVICRQGGIKWRVRNGLVELVSGETRTGRTYLVPYGVHDLVLGVKNKKGPELKLSVPGEEDFGFDDDEEPAPTVVDEGRLEGLITNNIAPDTWDEIGVLRYQQGVLLIRHTREVHEQVSKLLADLRQAVGIQVDIEARFLKVEDSFLEDVGVDFRGLGNQASEGIPGRGLETRQNLRFDDFGRPETINPAVPGEIGTGTEPGIFYDDGGDGDMLARTENLFDTDLGGGEEGLDNSGGLSLQAVFLDDIELEVVLRAVRKQERSEEIVAPRLLVYNNTRAHMSALRHTSYIRDFEVEIAQAAAVANPIVDVVRDGVVLDVRPVVSADRRFITMELRPTVMDLMTPIPTFSTGLGSGQPVNIQLPTVRMQSVRTTVTVPDASTLMLGGMKLSERQNRVSGIPFLQDVPLLSFFFSRKGSYVLNQKLLILIRASIILTEEHTPTLFPDEFEATLLGDAR